MKISSDYEEIIAIDGNSQEYENSDFSEFLFSGIKYNVKDIGDSRDVAKELGLKIKNNVPIYYIKGSGCHRKGAFDSKRNIIFIFDNADEITLKHEIIHSIEFNKPIHNELDEFYELVKTKVNEESFDGGAVTFNFKKNIHEFIADGYSKLPFINALKKELMYDDFLNKTKYIFE